MSLLNIIGGFFFNPKVKEKKNISELKRIKLTSQIASVGLFTAIIYQGFFLSINSRVVDFLEIIFSVCYLGVLIVNLMGYTTFAKFFLILTFFINFFIVSIIFGEQACVHLLYIPALTAPLILFDFSKIKLIIMLALIAFTMLIVLYSIDFAPSLTIPLSTAYMYKLKFSFILTSMVGQFIVIYAMIYSFRSTEKKLDENNIILEQQFESIFNNSYDALFLVDSGAKKIVKANKRAVELFEMESEESFYSHYGLDFHKNAPSKKELDHIVNEVLTKGIYKEEVIYKTKKGNEFWGALAIRAMIINGKRYQSVRVADISANSVSFSFREFLIFFSNSF